MPEWIATKDGDPRGLEIFRRHYTFNPKRNQMSFWHQKSEALYVGPGEKLVLLLDDASALFVWRKEKYRLDSQTGVNCAVFRNEGPALSSELIRKADRVALEKWPGERLFTFVDPKRTRRKRDPGRCFLRAGWRYCGWTKAGLRILEKINPDLARCDREITEIQERSDVVAGRAPAWLVTLGVNDWEVERRLILRERAKDSSISPLQSCGAGFHIAGPESRPPD